MWSQSSQLSSHASLSHNWVLRLTKNHHTTLALCHRTLTSCFALLLAGLGEKSPMYSEKRRNLEALELSMGRGGQETEVEGYT